MVFKSGRQAYEYYIANKDTYADLECNTMARLMENAGAALEYDANTLSSSTPYWAERLETLIDLERILNKHITRDEQRIMRLCIERTDSMKEYKGFRQYKVRANREKYVFTKFTEILRAYDYISEKHRSGGLKTEDDLSWAA